MPWMCVIKGASVSFKSENPCEIKTNSELPQGFDALVDRLHAHLKAIHKDASLERGVIVYPFD